MAYFLVATSETFDSSSEVGGDLVGLSSSNAGLNPDSDFGTFPSIGLVVVGFGGDVTSSTIGILEENIYVKYLVFSYT